MSKLSSTPSNKPPTQSTPPFRSGGSSTPSNQLGALGTRFGSRAVWEILPLNDTLVCFDLPAVADALLAQHDLPDVEDAEPGDAFLSALENQKALAEIVKTELDDEWDTYHLRGAVLVYAWREDIRQAVNARLMAIKASGTYVRSLDPLLVLNVLARARTTLLLANAPLALERSFLNRAILSDDPRLVKLARSKPFSEEPFTEQESGEHEDEE